MVQVRQGDIEGAKEQAIRDLGGNPNMPVPGVTGNPFQTILRDPGTSGQATTNTYERNLGDTATNKPTDQSARVGDYALVKGQYVVAPQSATDIVNRYTTVSGGTKMEGTSFGDVLSATGAALRAVIGLGDDLGTTAAYQVARFAPGGKAISAGAAFTKSLMDTANRYADEWANTMVDVDLPVTVVEEDGKRKAKIDYGKMASAGIGSGSSALKANDTDFTSVKMNGDNNMVINVSDTFANSAKYSEVLKEISDAYGSLTEKQANEVVDEDTGTTRIQSIEEYVKSMESQYYFNANLEFVLRQAAPTASQEYIDKGTQTLLSGYTDESNLSEIDITVYDMENNEKVVNAKEYYDSFKNLDKTKRNDEVVGLSNKLNDSNISDDEKAVIKAQLQALYTLSSNDGTSYTGMLKKDFFDSVGDNFILPFSGRRAGDLGLLFGGYGTLDGFTDDDFYSGLTSLGTSLGHIFALAKTMNLIEKGVRAIPGLRKISALAPQGANIGSDMIANYLAAETASGQLAAIGSGVARQTIQNAFNLGSDAIYEAGKAATHLATGTLEDFDFFEELGYDAAMDLLVSYGPSAYADLVRGDNVKYKWEKVEEGKKVSPDAIKVEKVYEYDDSLDVTKDGIANSKEDIAETYQLLKVTAGDLSKQHAATVDKLTDSKLALKTQELFSDKNAAMQKLAIQTLKVTGDNYLFQKTLRFASDVKNLAKFYQNDFKVKYNDNWTNLGNKLNEIVPKNEKLSDADVDYINAKAQKARFTQLNKGDEAVIKKVNAKYDPAINAVSPDRAAKLDELSTALSYVAKDILEYAKNNNLLTDEAVKRISAYDGYIPVWTKDRAMSFDREIASTRATAKKIFDEKMLYDLDSLQNPLLSLMGEINNITRNVAVNQRALAMREAASIAGVGIHVVEDAGGALADVKGLKEYNADFKKTYDNIVKRVKKDYPDQIQWQESNNKIVLSSKSLKTANELGTLTKEGTALRKKLREANKKLAAAPQDARFDENLYVTTQQRIDYLENSIRELRNPSSTVDWILNIPIKSRESQAKKFEGYLKAQNTIASNIAKSEWGKARQEVDDVRAEIAINRQSQDMLMDQIRDEIKSSMKKAQKGSNNPMKLDINSYVNVELTKNLVKALSGGNTVGKIQAVLNEAVEKANPYVDPELIIARESEKAAVKFRKKVYKNIAFKNNAYKKGSDKFNDAVDKVTDSVVRKVLGENGNKATMLSDNGRATKVVATGRENTIKYKLDGKEYTMVLTGKGAQELVEEFNRAEFTTPKNMADAFGRKLLKVGNDVAQAKRYLTTSADPARVIPNLLRDWSGGIVSTGGKILLSPDTLRTEVISTGNYSAEEIGKIDRAFNQIVEPAVSGSTFTQSLASPKRNQEKSMRKALNSTDNGDAFVTYNFGKVLKETAKDSQGFGEKLSILQDSAETFTRMKAAQTAYYKEISDSSAKGLPTDVAIERATEAAYFAGVESTVNFARRGILIEKIAKLVPYLSQNFASLESRKLAWLNDPIAVTNSLKSFVMTYAACESLLLSNDESRKKYYNLTEYDRANNILFPLDNGTIITIPMDENLAAFVTPYRRAIETLNGVDPEAFYLWGKDFLEALSPLDFSGFSEGDAFNIQRGFEKLGSQLIPTFAQPFIEIATGRDLYYGTEIRMDAEKTGEYYGNWSPTPGEMTTKGKNSQLLANIANATGIPQWMLQNIYSEYAGNVGAEVLNTIDKLSGATEDAQGGKEFFDSIFKPLTGNDSTNAINAFNNGISQLQNAKKQLQNELKTINTQLETAVGDNRARILENRQKKINDYGTKVSDFVGQYLSAFEITGGLTKKQANSVWYLFMINDENLNKDMVSNVTTAGENYYYDKAKSVTNKRAQNLAGISGIDRYINADVVNAGTPYSETHGKQLFDNSIYGDKVQYVNGLYKTLEKGYGDNNFYTLRSNVNKARQEAYRAGDFTKMDALAYDYDKKVVEAVMNYVENTGKSVDDVLNNYQAIDYLKDWIIVPSSFEKTAKGKYVPSLMQGAEKQEAFKKPFIKYLFGLEDK